MKIVIQQYNIIKLKISIIVSYKFKLFRKISPGTFSPPCIRLIIRLYVANNSAITFSKF